MSQYRTSAVALFLLTCSFGRAENDLDKAFRAALEEQNQSLTDDVFVPIARASHRTANQVRADLLLLSLYRHSRDYKVAIDRKAVQLPKRATKIERSPEVSRISWSTWWTLNGLDKLIAEDRAFLGRDEIKPAHRDYVSQRVEALRRMRKLVVDGLEEHFDQEAQAGDELMDIYVAGQDYEEMEANARHAENRLGQHGSPNSRKWTTLTQSVARVRQLQRGQHRNKGREKLHKALVNTTFDQGEFPPSGDFTVVVFRIKREWYGGIGELIPGRKVHIKQRDTYHVSTLQDDKHIDKMKHWKKLYDFDWTYSDHDSSIARGSLEIIGLHRNLSKKKANAMHAKAVEHLTGSGYRYTNLGYIGPAHGKYFPATVPSNVKTIIDRSKKKR